MAAADAYGFPLPQLSKGAAAARQRNADKASRRASKWSSSGAAWRAAGGGGWKERVRKGVPAALRMHVWLDACYGAGQEALQEGEYGRLVAQAEDEARGGGLEPGEAGGGEQGEQAASGAGADTPRAAAAPASDNAASGFSPRKASADVDNDLMRTFPTHPWVASGEGQAALRRVLLAAAVHNPAVGYCQGLNFVAALLLLVCREAADTAGSVVPDAPVRGEEAAFWLLVAMMERIQYIDLYARDLVGCQVELRVLEGLLQDKLPKLAHHFEAMGCPLAMLTTDWFLCAYSKVVPAETAVRIWDCLFAEGAKVLFRVALVFFGEAEKELLAMDNAGEALQLLKARAGDAHDADALLQEAFGHAPAVLRRVLPAALTPKWLGGGVGSLPMRRINEARALGQIDVEREMAEVREKRAEYRRKAEEERRKQQEANLALREAQVESRKVEAGMRKAPPPRASPTHNLRYSDNMDSKNGSPRPSPSGVADRDTARVAGGGGAGPSRQPSSSSTSGLTQLVEAKREAQEAAARERAAAEEARNRAALAEAHAQSMQSELAALQERLARAEGAGGEVEGDAHRAAPPQPPPLAGPPPPRDSVRAERPVHPRQSWTDAIL